MSDKQKHSAQYAERQEMARQVYDYIRAYIDETGWAPSLRQIARGCYISRSHVVRYLDLLEAWGYIEREPGLSRAIRVVDPNRRL